MKWGHTLRGKDGEEEVTRAEWNAAFGDAGEARTPDEPEIPDCLFHVWEWWWQLHARRPPGFEAAAALSWSEIAAWISLTRTWITPEEIGLLVRMDDAWLQAVAEERRDARERAREQMEREQQQAMKSRSR